ncbi:MAG: DNA topoisomerase I [Chloroflexi bacterium]|nr:DNA topoisomerase I [Chloroflexota bacterium]|tara:strand:- start:7664 stop:9931 length:2268 start_codon:yes stop_codon:yes gene_type:complete
MSKNLVIVESPAKARTVGRFLGSKYEVIASMGHVRDLANTGPGGLGIDIVEDKDGIMTFNPKYTSIIDPKTKKVDSRKKKIIADIKKSAINADIVYLATDADREGEAISWHLLEAAKIQHSKIKRVVFNEITKSAIEEAFANTRELDLNLVDAYQARRMIDKIIGYKGSSVLWKKVKSKISAGRVQSVALKLVVNLEEKIQDFKKVEFWNIHAYFNKLDPGKKSENFSAKLYSIQGENKKPLVPDEEKAKLIIEDLKDSNYQVQKIETQEKIKKPSPPFITSTLQQDASRTLRFNPSYTMNIAQQLYQGLKIGSEGEVGLITYMRTDSTNVSSLFLNDAKKYILDTYGNDYLPSSPRRYSKKIKGAQEAHEAIRPTSVFREPESIKSYLDDDQFKLYELIWKRMVASQMENMVLDSTTIDVVSDNSSSKKKYTFQMLGSVVKFKGFKILYTEGTDDLDVNDENNILPILYEDEILNCSKLQSEQKFTEPPRRYTEASLIRDLEKAGIGRPSTYATIVKTIQDRGYAIKEKGRFIPTKLGNVVTNFLNEYFFNNIMDVKFTAKIEKQLDDIVEGHTTYNPVLSSLYSPFQKALKNAEESDGVKNLLYEETEFVCQICERIMLKRDGRNGAFLACSGFPECRNTMQLGEDGKTVLPKIPPVETDYECEKCNKTMVIKEGRRGKFLACSGFPKCRNTMQLAEDGKTAIPKSLPKETDIKCEKCNKTMVIKDGRRGEFLACSGFPRCKNAKSITVMENT